MIDFFGRHGSTADNPVSRKIESLIIESPLYYATVYTLSIRFRPSSEPTTPPLDASGKTEAGLAEKADMLDTAENLVAPEDVVVSDAVTVQAEPVLSPLGKRGVLAPGSRPFI
jgi:hypothetical protein